MIRRNEFSPPQRREVDEREIEVVHPGHVLRLVERADFQGGVPPPEGQGEYCRFGDMGESDRPDCQHQSTIAGTAPSEKRDADLSEHAEMHSDRDDDQPDAEKDSCWHPVDGLPCLVLMRNPFGQGNVTLVDYLLALAIVS